ncbi:uncharacterized protein LOC114355696 [Ostrinia furnacalis]|uniref:uncharacterized protein LOC114355696 n=1 Tax=Ostrinia furnacalis TaxID=93504 RepID=UPI00103A8296|nr:uncharacterized protein LOC114355696 [Ostrinia furnacalis]
MKYSIAAIQIVIVALIVFEAQSQRPEFRNDYRFEKAFNAFYKVHFVPEPWAKARIRCEAEGTELMVPENLDEADALPVLIMGILDKFLGVYVGMHDLYAERVFVTINGNVMLHSILNLLWEQKEPEFKGGRCVAMRRSGRLFVHPCEMPLPFVCKVSAQRIVPKPECNSYNLNWTKGPNETCYMAHIEPQNWFDAYSTCLAGGGNLVVLNDREEAEYIKQLFKEIGERRMPNNDIAFLGFSDLFQQHHYRTVHGERVQDTGYSDWDLKCSSNNASGRVKEQRCGSVRRSGLLTVSDCNTPAMFFCEKRANHPSRLARAVSKHP